MLENLLKAGNHKISVIITQFLIENAANNQVKFFYLPVRTDQITVDKSHYGNLLKLLWKMFLKDKGSSDEIYINIGYLIISRKVLSLWNEIPSRPNGV